MATKPSENPESTKAVRSPRRWLRRVGWTAAALASLVVLLGLLFVVNGLWLAHNETPVLGITQPAAGAQVQLDEDHADPAKVKVLSFNIAKGFVYESGISFAKVAAVEQRMQAIAVLIREEQPDVVFLSESIFECGPCPVNQVEYLSRETGLKHWAFGENYNFGLPFYRVIGGNAILSRWPLTAVGNPPLAGRRPFYITRNNRRALWCSVTLGGRSLLLGAIHNDSFDMDNNLVQARQELAYAGDRPAMLAGDFNARPTEPAIKFLRQSGRFTAAYDGPLTFPTDKPDQTIDFIFAPADWTLVEHHVPKCDASDHLPIVSTFRRTAKT